MFYTICLVVIRISFLQKECPIYYYFGTRKDQVKHCRLRLAISDLNYDLFRRHLCVLNKTLCVHADIQQKHQSISYYIVPFIIVLEIKPLIN